MANAYFVTGTDTDVGKTLVAAGLLAAANAKGFSTAAIKPVAAGCVRTPEGLLCRCDHEKKFSDLCNQK
jgi:dethiobiotin synthetase